MAPDRRRSDRTASWVDASCHLHGHVSAVRLTDVSHDGCRGEVAARSMVPGDRVMLELSELLVLPATVAWVNGDETGFQFANPMLGALLSQFAMRHGRGRRLH